MVKRFRRRERDMGRETSTVCYDEELNMEAYHLEGLVCPGDVILFNPGDSHCCEQLEGAFQLPGGQYPGGGHGAFCAGDHRERRAAGFWRACHRT